MPEIEAYRDQTFLAHQRVDKIDDMQHKTGLRRINTR